MTALVYVRNDGPDSCEIDVGKRSILLGPGEEVRLATNTMRPVAVPPPPTEYMGVPLESAARIGEE